MQSTELTHYFRAPSAPSRAKALAKCSLESARELISVVLARQFSVLPLSLLDDDLRGRTLTVLGCRRLTAAEEQSLKFAASVSEVVVEIENDAELIQQAIRWAYGVDTARCLLKDDRSLLEGILEAACSEAASDLHLELCEEGLSILMRIDGHLRKVSFAHVGREEGIRVLRRIRVLAEIPIDRDQSPGEGSFTFTSATGERRVRASVVPTFWGGKAVLRLLDSVAFDEHPSFAQLGMSVVQEQFARVFLGLDAGLIIATGPTGCGKSTLLYAFVEHLRDQGRSVVTVEDPVERHILGVTQIGVDAKHGVGFREVLSVVMRQDPDALLVGEVRDSESAELAMNAALTGHLVLTTLHSSNCLEALARLSQLGCSATTIAAGLRLIVSQRLVPLSCERCREPIILSRPFAELFNFPADIRLFQSVGCDICSFRGVSGRIGIFEFLRLTDEIRAVIADNNGHLARPYELRRLAQAQGYEPFACAVRRLLVEGSVAPISALKILGLDPNLFGYG